MGVVYRKRELPTERNASTEYAGSALVVGLQCEAWF
jgi:hypothetical protein